MVCSPMFFFLSSQFPYEDFMQQFNCNEAVASLKFFLSMLHLVLLTYFLSMMTFFKICKPNCTTVYACQAIGTYCVSLSIKDIQCGIFGYVGISNAAQLFIWPIYYFYPVWPIFSDWEPFSLFHILHLYLVAYSSE